MYIIKRIHLKAFSLLEDSLNDICERDNLEVVQIQSPSQIPNQYEILFKTKSQLSTNG